MSWAKELAEAGLAGLSEREAARGALCEVAFQLIPTPDVRRIIVLSKFKSRLILHVFNVEDIEDAYSSSVYLIQKEEKDDDEWIHHVLDPQNRQEAAEAISCCKLIFY